MPKIEPFKGILYNPRKVDISKVVAPPYDVISPEMQNDLYRADAHNIIRLILGKEEPGDSKTDNKYKRAKKFFKAWIKNEILIQDSRPSIYTYRQEYLHPAPCKYSKKENVARCGVHDGKKKKRLGFIARMKIEDPRTSKVFPHEYTFLRPKQDRMNLLREVKANLSPIFTLFQDEAREVKSVFAEVIDKRPALDLQYDGVRHRLWKMEDRKLIKRLQQAMRDKDIFIADGHHRYEVALMYRNQMRKSRGTLQCAPTKERKNKGYDYVMTYFSPMNHEGITILSTHRLIKCVKTNIDELLRDLKAYFFIKTFKTEKALFKKMAVAKEQGCVFGMYFKNRPFYLLKLKKEVCLNEVIKEDKSGEWKKLDVSILHSIILDNILGLREKVHNEECVIYTRDADYAISEVKSGGCEIAFFLNPTKVSQVQTIAKRGDKMPHKSTYFYPKLLSGLVMNKLA